MRKNGKIYFDDEKEYFKNIPQGDFSNMHLDTIVYICGFVERKIKSKIIKCEECINSIDKCKITSTSTSLIDCKQYEKNSIGGLIKPKDDS